MRTRVRTGRRGLTGPTRARIGAAAVACAAVVVSTACGPAPPGPAGTPADATPGAAAPDAGLPSEAAFLAQIDRTKGTRDCFSVIKDPQFLPADGSGGAHGVADAEYVVCLDLGATQVCFPTLYLDYHEIVEFRLEGLELLACW